MHQPLPRIFRRGPLLFSDFFYLFRAELRQIEEIVSAIFHTLLYHRSVGKFKYQRQEGRASSYSVGVVGAADVDCDFIDYTYVRADSQVGEF